MPRLPFLSLASFCWQTPLPVLSGFPSQCLKCRFAARAPEERYLTQQVVFSPREGNPFQNVWCYGRVGCCPEQHRTCSNGPIACHIFPFIRAGCMHLYRMEKEKAWLAFERERTTLKALCCVQRLSFLLKGCCHQGLGTCCWFLLVLTGLMHPVSM